MPGISGTDVLERLAADTATREIPVVVLTATELDDVDRREAWSASGRGASRRTRSPRRSRQRTLTETLARLGLA